MGLQEIRVLMGLNSRFPTVLEATINAFESALAEAEDDPTHDASERAQHLSKVAMVSKKPGHHLDAHAQHMLARDAVKKRLGSMPADHPKRNHVATMAAHHAKLASLHQKHAGMSAADDDKKTG